MRNIAFSMTKEQIRNRIKTVTRRDGWKNAKPGDLLCAVEKVQGLKKGEKVVRICVIRVVNARRESLFRLIEDIEYGKQEVILEGLPEMTPQGFVDMFNKDEPYEVTRIEFEYIVH
jgi:hypothetical protein